MLPMRPRSNEIGAGRVPVWLLGSTATYSACDADGVGAVLQLLPRMAKKSALRGQLSRARSTRPRYYD